MRISLGRLAAHAVPVAALGAAALLARTAGADMPPVPVPAENPITEEKRVLGKILFWDEQMSADDTVACGTCHKPGRGGADPRRLRHPGADGVAGTADDVQGSPGVIRRDAAGDFAASTAFGLDVQATGRTSMPFTTAAWANRLFWDGRAGPAFDDPVSGQRLISTGGALEAQAVGPPLSGVEMAHDARNWTQVTAKLARVTPLGIATNVPEDAKSAIDTATSDSGTFAAYPELFRRAFGTSDITVSRIAFALATYQRTLVPDQTPWDRFQAGETTALTAQQVRGMNAFQASRCNVCHEAPVFSDGTFRNIGLRPVADDIGRQGVTGNQADRGRMKVPSLRNVGLRASFMRNGQFTTLTDVIRFYARAPGTTQFTENIDPVVPQINVPPPAAADIEAFLATGLTDPRVAAETFPFDRPTLASESGRAPAQAAAARAGSGGVAPRMLAPMPASLGNTDFRVGLARALGGATASLVLSRSAPVGGAVAADEVLGSTVLPGSGSGAGFSTVAWPIEDDLSRDGEVVWLQWRIDDPAAIGGVALSEAVRVELFATHEAPPEPPAPLVIGDDELFASAGSFSIDWRSHGKGAPAADRFRLKGALPASVDPRGATLRVSLGGTRVADIALDADGRARTDEFRARVDPATGEFDVDLRDIDLRAASGLFGFGGRGEAEIDVAFELDSAENEPFTLSARVPFAWKTREFAATAATFKFARDGLPSGAFAVTRLELDTDGGTGAVRIARLDLAVDPGEVSAAGGLVCEGALTVTIGDADAMQVPVASMLLREADGSFRAVGPAPVARLRYDASARAMDLRTSAVEGLSAAEGAVTVTLVTTAFGGRPTTLTTSVRPR